MRNKTNETNKKERSLENEILVEWFIYLVENIGEEEKADQKSIQKYIKEIENYKGLDFFKVQEIVNKFIEEIKK